MRTYEVVKRHKRLWVMEGGLPIYTPPNFVRLHGREPLAALAGVFTEAGARDINAIAAFESAHSTRRAPTYALSTHALSLD